MVSHLNVQIFHAIVATKKQNVLNVGKNGFGQKQNRGVNMTKADEIRNMSDEELAELITGSLNFDCPDYCDSFMNGCAFKCNKKDREIALKWLQSEAE